MGCSQLDVVCIAVRNSNWMIMLKTGTEHNQASIEKTETGDATEQKQEYRNASYDIQQNNE